MKPRRWTDEERQAQREMIRDLFQRFYEKREAPEMNQPDPHTSKQEEIQP